MRGDRRRKRGMCAASGWFGHGALSISQVAASTELKAPASLHPHACCLQGQLTVGAVEAEANNCRGPSAYIWSWQAAGRRRAMQPWPPTRASIQPVEAQALAAMRALSSSVGQCPLLVVGARGDSRSSQLPANSSVNVLLFKRRFFSAAPARSRQSGMCCRARWQARAGLRYGTLAQRDQTLPGSPAAPWGADRMPRREP